MVRALKGGGDLNKDGWITGAEMVNYLKRNLLKGEKLNFRKHVIVGSMNGEFLFSMEPEKTGGSIASGSFFQKSSGDDITQNEPFVELTLEEMDKNVFWPPDEASLKANSPKLQEETFSKLGNQKISSIISK